LGGIAHALSVSMVAITADTIKVEASVEPRKLRFPWKKTLVFSAAGLVLGLALALSVPLHVS